MADTDVKTLLESTRTIALVGASNKPERASYRVFNYLLEQGYDVYPINPVLAGQMLVGRPVLASLTDVPVAIDLVDIFRQSEAAGEVVDQAIAANAKAVWLQLGVINEAAKSRAEAAGLAVVMDRCPKIDIPAMAITTPKKQGPKHQGLVTETSV